MVCKSACHETKLNPGSITRTDIFSEPLNHNSVRISDLRLLNIGGGVRLIKQAMCTGSIIKNIAYNTQALL